MSSIQSTTEKDVLRTLAELGGRLTQEDDLVFEGKRFVIPDSLRDLDDAIAFLQHYQKAQEEMTEYSRTFKFRPWDGAAATERALKRVFGTAGIGKSVWTMFGKKAPESHTINVGPDETIQVPWGTLEVPMLHGTVTLGASSDAELGLLYAITVTAPKKFRSHVEGFFKAINEELQRESIYRGKAVTGGIEPEFMTLGIDPTKVVYSDQTLADLEANVWDVIAFADANRQLGLPLKRSVLLEGPFGTGKTLAATLTAQVAVANGWTFIYARPNQDDLSQVLQTARLYQPAVVFCEDVDVIADSEQTENRDQVTKILDVFDGMRTKNVEIMMILTTNHKERLQKGLTRPGRLDAMIHVGELDGPGIIRMIHALCDDTQLGVLDSAAICDAMEGYLPAFVKEAVDRAQRYALSRADGDVSNLRLETEDFVNAAHGLREQFNLMLGASEGVKADPLSVQLKRIAVDAIEGVQVTDPDRGNNVAYELHEAESTDG
jgi:transitional endoplasmic reticulum ATPase